MSILQNFVSGEEYHKFAKYSICPRQKIINLDTNISENDIVFINLDYFNTLIEQFISIKPINRVILLTQNSDKTFTQEHFESVDKYVNKIYAINCNYAHEKIEKIPIGFRDNRYSIHQPLRTISLLKLEKDILIYMNFTMRTNYNERIKCFNAFKDLGFVTKENNIPLSNFYSQIAKSKYIISPVGEGIDCHRIYESIYLNSIPIVKSTLLDDFYRTLPIIIVNDWNDITEHFLLTNYSKYKDNLDYWKIKNKDWMYVSFWIEK